MVENKEVMARNIKHYMEKNNVNATEICKALGIKQNTFSDWVNAKTYPRIDKIEMMAKFFHISKAFLVEDIAEVDYISPDEMHLIEMFRRADATTSSIVYTILTQSGKSITSDGTNVTIK